MEGSAFRGLLGGRVCQKVLRNDGVCCVLSFLYVVSCKFEMCFGDDSVFRRRWLSEVLFRFKIWNVGEAGTCGGWVTHFSCQSWGGGVG